MQNARNKDSEKKNQIVQSGEKILARKNKQIQYGTDARTRTSKYVNSHSAHHRHRMAWGQAKKKSAKFCREAFTLCLMRFIYVDRKYCLEWNKISKRG